MNKDEIHIKTVKDDDQFLLIVNETIIDVYANAYDVDLAARVLWDYGRAMHKKTTCQPYIPSTTTVTYEEWKEGLL